MARESRIWGKSSPGRCIASERASLLSHVVTIFTVLITTLDIMMCRDDVHRLVDFSWIVEKVMAVADICFVESSIEY